MTVWWTFAKQSMLFQWNKSENWRNYPCIHTLCKSFAWSHLREHGTGNGNHQQNMNGVTSYKLPISDKVLSNKRNWNIIWDYMKLELFSDALQAASQPVEDGGLGIKSIFIEKDYWICRSLSLMAANDKDNRAIFKGGTSLTKAYGIGSRFSYQK